MKAHGMLLATILLIFGIFHESYGEDRTESTVRKLRQYLFQTYDVNARSVIHHDNTTEITIGFTPVHITEINENNGIMIMEGWITLSWIDEHLKWDPTKFSGIKVLHISENDVWKPDITVYNGKGGNNSPWGTVNLLLWQNGMVMWVPPATLELLCGFTDYTNYPNDVQECKLILGSWTNDAYKIDLKLQSEKLNLTEYHNSTNPHWVILSASGKRNVKYYDCCAEPYVSVSYKMKIKRTHVPFSALCATPDTVARLLILCMFWISSGTGKLLVGCTSLLILSAISVGITVSLPSPAAATAALSPVASAFALCIAAIIVELLVVAVSTFRLASPSFLEGLSSSSLCQLLVPCRHEYSKEDLIDGTASTGKKNHWPFASILIDRAGFVVFTVLLVAM